MARISTLSREQLPDFEPMFQILDNTMGYIPNNFLSMAHWPELLGLLAVSRQLFCKLVRSREV